MTSQAKSATRQRKGKFFDKTRKAHPARSGRAATASVRYNHPHAVNCVSLMGALFGKRLASLKKESKDDFVLLPDPASDLVLSTRNTLRSLLRADAVYRFRAPLDSSPGVIATASSTIFASAPNLNPNGVILNWSSLATLFDEYRVHAAEAHFAWTTPIVTGLVATELQPLQMACSVDNDSGGTPGSYQAVLEHVGARVLPITNTHPAIFRHVTPRLIATSAATLEWLGVANSWPGSFQLYAISPTSSTIVFGTLTRILEVDFRFRA